MQFEIVNPILEPRWSEWLLEYENATFFHTAPWARVLTETYGYGLMYGVLRESGRVQAILPLLEVASRFTGRRGVSLPFSDECAPLLGDGATLPALVEPLIELGRRRGWDYLELRGEAQALPAAVRSDEFMVHELTLEAGEEEQFQRLKNTHRRNIQKARKEGIEIHRLTTREATAAYYALHCRTRRRHGLPPQPLRFFLKIHEHVLEKGHGFINLARWQSRWVAGAVYFHFGTRALYKFGASDFAYQHLRANNLLMWEAINHFRAAGWSRFSFGRTSPHNAGLLQFKRGWGAQEIARCYHRIGIRRPARARSMDREEGTGLTGTVVRRMPIALLRVVGMLMYRHMG